MKTLYLDVTCSNCRAVFPVIITLIMSSAFVPCVHETCPHCGFEGDHEEIEENIMIKTQL